MDRRTARSDMWVHTDDVDDDDDDDDNHRRRTFIAARDGDGDERRGGRRTAVERDVGVARGDERRRAVRQSIVR